MLARDKHSSLLQKFVNYGRKIFYNIGPSDRRKCITILKKLSRDKRSSLFVPTISDEEGRFFNIDTSSSQKSWTQTWVSENIRKMVRLK
jgi:hypothetical protein